MTTHLFTAALKTPAILNNFGLCLESLLSAAVHEQTGKIGDEAMKDVPITFNEVAGYRIYNASCGFFVTPMSFGQESIGRRRRRDEIGDDFYAGKKMRKGAKEHPWFINQNKGEFCALLNNYRTVNVPALAWFAETSDPERVVQMIESLGWVGKRRGQGFGELGAVSYRVLQEEHARAIFDADGIPRRPIPRAAWDVLATSPRLTVPFAPSRGYAPSAWGNEPLMCAVPASPYLPDMSTFGIVKGDGDEIFFE